MITYNYKKGTQLVNYIIRHLGGKADKTKVIKLLWAADRYHVRKYARLVTNDNYSALPKGPVASQTLDVVNRKNDEHFNDSWDRAYITEYISIPEDGMITSLKSVDKSLLSETDLEALDFALSLLSEKSTDEIVKFSHKYPEWDSYKKITKTSNKKSVPINTLSFFDNPVNMSEDIFTLPSQALTAAKGVYEDTLIPL